MTEQNNSGGGAEAEARSLEPVGPDDNAGWLDTLAHFDWLKIPGAVRAIARLVAGSADAAQAWLEVAKAKGEQKARAIRDVTVARSETTRALTKAVARKVGGEPELLERATNYLVLEQLQKQKNREAVGRETARLLSEDMPQDPAEPDADWLNVFAAFAEKASSERTQQHWASVLAGEIRKPGSFSLTTLQLLSVIDAALAQILSEARAWIVDDRFIPGLGKLWKGPEYSKLLKLDAVGFLKLGSASYLSKPNPGHAAYLRLGEKQIIVKAATREIPVQSGILTGAGKELLQLVAPAKADPETLDAFVAYLRANGAEIEVIDAEQKLDETMETWAYR